jgi:hypothetical protein
VANTRTTQIRFEHAPEAQITPQAPQFFGSSEGTVSQPEAGPQSK